MKISVNQILFMCLIAVLVALVVVLAIMAKHVLELVKKSKGLVNHGNKAVDDIQKRAGVISDKLSTAVDNIAEETSPTVKTLGAVATGLAAVNSVGIVGKLISLGGLASILSDNKEAAKAKRTTKESKKAVKQLKKQARYEKKLIKQNAKIAKIKKTTGEL